MTGRDDGPRVSRIYLHGKTPKAYARRAARWAHNPNYRVGKFDGWQMNANQRLSEIGQLARHRVRQRLSIGSEQGWALVISNALWVLNHQVTERDVHRIANEIHLPRLDAETVALAVSSAATEAGGSYRLYSPAKAGELLEVSSVEREEAEIFKIDAVDEPKVDRIRRVDRMRKVESRAADAAMRPSKRPKADIVAELMAKHGKSQATIYRWLREGRIPDPGDEKNLVLGLSPTVEPRTQKFSSASAVPGSGPALPVPGEFHETTRPRAKRSR